MMNDDADDTPPPVPYSYQYVVGGVVLVLVHRLVLVLVRVSQTTGSKQQIQASCCPTVDPAQLLPARQACRGLSSSRRRIAVAVEFA